MRWSPITLPRPGCPHRRLLRLLAAELPAGVTLLAASTLRPWASANFIGARHLFPCAVPADEAASLRADFQAHLAAVEWRLSGHIVADIVIEPGAAADSWRIEILTVED